MAYRDLMVDHSNLLCCLADISNQCIGELAMGYKLDANSIGSDIYAATGMNNVELNKATK